LLRRHANAAIGNRKLDPVASLRHLAHPQSDLALLGELAGIAQEIEQYLTPAASGRDKVVRMRAPGKLERRDGRSAVVLSDHRPPPPLGPQLGAGGNGVGAT